MRPPIRLPRSGSTEGEIIRSVRFLRAAAFRVAASCCDCCFAINEANAEAPCIFITSVSASRRIPVKTRRCRDAMAAERDCRFRAFQGFLASIWSRSKGGSIWHFVSLMLCYQRVDVQVGKELLIFINSCSLLDITLLHRFTLMPLNGVRSSATNAP